MPSPHDRPQDDEPRLPLKPVGESLSVAAAMMRNMPVLGSSIAAAQDEWGRVEHVIWREVRQRLQEEPTNGVPTGTPNQLLTALLTASVEQSAVTARERLLIRLLNEIEPDEARMLAALSDGTTYPLIHVVTRAPLGGTGARLLENVSTIGRSAGISLPDYVPIYVARMRRLGLVTVAPESAEHADGYELLMSESLVIEAREAYESGTKVLRRTLSLSRLGRDLWDVSTHG